MASFKDQGNEAFKQKNYEQAIELYAQAIAENPTDHTILSNRSAAFHNLKRHQEAIADAEKCIQIKPDFGKGYMRKGMAQHALNQLAEAVQNYEECLKYDAGNAQCKQMLEQAEMQLMQQTMGGMGGGMGGGMPGMDGDGPFSAAKLEALKTNPKIAEFMKDVKFKNLYDLCIQNPQMLIQFIQMDPRFQVVF